MLRKKSLFLVILVSLLLMITSLYAAVKIQFWHMYDSGPAKELMDSLIAEFNEMHKGEIEVEDLGISFWDYWDKLGVAIAAGQEPDVFQNDLGNVGGRADSGLLENLLPYLKEKGVNPDEVFFEEPLKMCKLGEGLYALPFETDVRLLFYNKKLFKEAGLDPNTPPKTWDELWEFADKITKVNEDGSYDVLGFNPIYGQSYFWMYVWGNGKSFIDENGNIVVNSPEIVELLEEWQEMIDKLGVEKLDEFNATYGWGPSDAFLNNKLGMVIQVGNFISQIKTFAPDLEYGVAYIPYPKTYASWSNGFSLELSSRSKHKKEAIEFMLFLTSKEPQFKLAKTLSSLVCNVKAAYDPELMSNPEWRIQVNTLNFTKFRPFVLEAPKWYEELQKAVDEVKYGKKTPQKALDDAQKRILSEIEKYRLTHKK